MIHFNNKIVTFNNKIIGYEVITEIPGSRYHTGYTTQTTQATADEVDNIVFDGLLFNNSISFVVGKEYGALMCWGANNIIIRNCRFENLYDFTAIKLIESYNVEIYNCDFINCYRGIEVARCTGKINIHNCDFKNITGHLVTPDFNCQVVQMIEGTGSDNKISLNAIENIQLESAPEDLINIYQSNFSNEGLVINKNWIRGGGPSISGGGILLGDMGGSGQVIEDNILVNPGQYGIGIAGGANMIVRRNKIFGEVLPWANVGLYAADWTPEISPNGNWTVRENRINYKSKDNLQSDYWVSEDDQWPNGWNTNTFNDVTLNSSILPAQIIGV